MFTSRLIAFAVGVLRKVHNKALYIVASALIAPIIFAIGVPLVVFDMLGLFYCSGRDVPREQKAAIMTIAAIAGWAGAWIFLDSWIGFILVTVGLATLIFEYQSDSTRVFAVYKDATLSAWWSEVTAQI